MMGAETARNPEKIGTSTVTLLPPSTRTVRLTLLPLSVTSVTVWRPGVTVHVTGDSPTALPSTSTRAPGGSVEITSWPSLLEGAGVVAGSFTGPTGPPTFTSGV